jgi:hypothetical protein
MEHEELSSTGAVMIAGVHASGPFVRLRVNRHSLRLSDPLLGSYEFTPEQVVSIEEATGFLYGGCSRIRHNVVSYPNKIFFRPSWKRKNLLDRICSTGFQPAAQATDTGERSIPVRWQAILAIAALWNLLLLLDELAPGNDGKPGRFAMLALLLLFICAMGLPWIEWLQKLILKPDRHLGEIRPWRNLIALVSGLMLPAFLLLSR